MKKIDADGSFGSAQLRGTNYVQLPEQATYNYWKQLLTGNNHLNYRDTTDVFLGG